jgi:hypothetical protein
MPEMKFEVLGRFIKSLIKAPYFLTTRQGGVEEVHLEVRYLEVTDYVKSSILHETVKLLNMPATEEVRGRLNDELTAIAEYTQKYSHILFTICLINETPIRMQLMQNGEIKSQSVIRTLEEVKQFISQLDVHRGGMHHK